MPTISSIASRNYSRATSRELSRPRLGSTRPLPLAATVALLVGLGLGPVCAQETRAPEITPEQGRRIFEQALRNAHRTEPQLVGSLRLYTPNHLFATYSVEVTDDHSPDRAPREIRISGQEQGRSTVLYDEREQDMFLYMFPLDIEESLLVTVWEAPVAMVVRVIRIRGGEVKLVMEDNAKDVPQFIVGEGIVLLGRGREMRGNLILPTQTQIRQWSSADDKFVLKATVPYGERWLELARLLGRGSLGARQD